MNHSQASREKLVHAAYTVSLDPAALKNACRSRYGCSVGELTDEQVAEFVETFPALAHTSALHELTGLGVQGPGGTYKPDADAKNEGPCDQCGRRGLWISGAGRYLCVAHQDNY